MAGMPGRSGGARPGAGRKPAPKPDPVVCSEEDPLVFLKSVMQGAIDPSPSQLKAAIAAAQYVHRKAGEGGKKDERANAAKVAAKGKFAAAPAPLKLVNTR
jgi:phage terminase small subunit